MRLPRVRLPVPRRDGRALRRPPEKMRELADTTADPRLNVETEILGGTGGRSGEGWKGYPMFFSLARRLREPDGKRPAPHGWKLREACRLSGRAVNGTKAASPEKREEKIR